MRTTEIESLVIESDSGARRPSSRIVEGILLGTALLWSLFQLWVSSPFYYSFVGWMNAHGYDISVLNNTETRSIHLGFAIFLSFLAYPAFKISSRSKIPVMDWVLASIGAYCAMYYYFNYEELSMRSGMATNVDIVVACTGILLLLEGTRRALGLPLVVIGITFLIYTLFGDANFIPEIIRHKPQSLTKIAGHQWLSTEGVFGIALGVSTDFVFLFVLFGALLDKAGAGNYFIKLAFSLLGHMKGGPAKAAVLSSAMTGLISGSSIANTVTTGTFTIPLMKRVGFSGVKAGAIEVSSSVNGQIMPPVMGAAAFLMVEYVGISYVEVIKHAFLPAVISYIALLYIVHLEAVKAGTKTLKKPITRTFGQSVLITCITISSIIILSGVIYFSIKWIKTVCGDNASLVLCIAVFTAYLLLLRYSCTVPELERDNPNVPIFRLPETSPTLKAGLHYILPIVALIWCLMVEKFSPGLSAYWATILMMFIILTQKMFKAIFRKEDRIFSALKEGGVDLLDGMITGARNMIGIGVATAAAGIIVGTVSLTGLGQVLTEVVEVLSGGSLFLILFFTAIICLILGMGLPTTANYIIVASLMAHVVQELGERNGLHVPLIAIHLFVFYFGIMADVTPPVGLASFAAAAISGANPIMTGVQAFGYSIRTAILPFFFIFNTELIMVGVESVWRGIWISFYATVAILLFSAAAQGYFLVKSRWYETIMLCAVSFMLFIPQVCMDLIFSPYEKADVMHIEEIVDVLVENNDGSPANARVSFYGEDMYGEIVQSSFTLMIDNTSKKTPLEKYGIFIHNEDGKMVVYDISFNSHAEKAGIDIGYVITGFEIPKKQPNVKLMYIPAIIFLMIVVVFQSIRRKRQLIAEQFTGAFI